MAHSNLKWEASENTLAAQRYWTGHGYTFKLTRRVITKDYYLVSKDGFDFKFEVYNNPACGIKDQMRDFERMFDTAYKLFKMDPLNG